MVCSCLSADSVSLIGGFLLHRSKELVDLGTDLHIPGKATEATAAVAQLVSVAPSVCRPSVCRVCSAAWTLASSTAAHSLAGVKG